MAGRFDRFTFNNSFPQPDSETTMQPSVEATGFQYINDSRQGGRLALAFANDNPFATVVQLTVGDLYGRAILVSNVVVPRYGTPAKFVDEIFPSLPRNHVGPIVVRAFLRVYTTGLRFNGATVSAISPAAQVP